MPELPEVETVRRTLAPRILGQTVASVRVRRRDVVDGPADPKSLLGGDVICGIERHGKELALRGRGGPVVCVHLGMTGSLCWTASANGTNRHTHVIWVLADGSRVQFRDPRRFGGVFPLASDALRLARWAGRGDDALLITPRTLARRLARTDRPLKAALLDQHVLAGLGNIYVDELLFACRLHPQTLASTIGLAEVGAMVRRMRSLLTRAIASGGSSVRDYVNGDGAAGAFQRRHRVYGRAGQPCLRCDAPLSLTRLAGRATVWCSHCQPQQGGTPTK